MATRWTLKQCFLFMDQNIEKIIMMPCYVAMSAIIFIEVIRRFIFDQQAAWSTQVPTCLFLIIVWIGCAQGVKNRSHLSFSEFRVRAPRHIQFVALLLDYLVWMILFGVVFYYSMEQALMVRSSFSTVFGTEFPLWYFYLAVPVGWMLLAYRVTQNVITDCRRFFKGEALLPDTAAESEVPQ